MRKHQHRHRPAVWQGGREVARILSERLGMEFYDGNLLVMAGKEYGIDLGTLQTYDEKGVGSVLHDLALVRATPYGSTVNEAPFQVYSAESRLVQQLVAKGPCIFLGRCTSQILKTEAHVPFVHAFIYASDIQDRIDRVREVDGVESSRIEAYITPPGQPEQELQQASSPTRPGATPTPTT